jgi:hypothetical protein
VTDPSGRISRFSRQEPLLFYQVAPQFVLTRLSAPRSRPTTFFLVVPGIEPGPLICSQELWPLDHRGGHYYYYYWQSFPCLEFVWESGSICPHFLDRGTSWRWVVSFTPLPLYPLGKSHRYPLEFGWTPEPVWRYGELKILYSTGTRTPTPLSSSP